MRSRCIAAALAAALTAALPISAVAATVATTTIVRPADGCGWAGGTWHFDAVTGTTWHGGGYA